jgi:hypothetical protein
MWKLAQLTREGAEFVIAVPPAGQGEPEALGTQNFTALAEWARHAAAMAHQLGDRIGAGPLSHVAGHNLERQVLMLTRGERVFLVGWPAEAADNLPEKSRKLVASWDS